ncbi:MAG TPA: P-II family nitrogen regulator [Polyangiaceae bacterium]|nr:P-II family nitrogen regulator [Polyangiaceae bacterium]
MKRIDTLIQPALWDEAHAALETLGARVTVREVRTFGRVPPKREVYRGSAYFLDFSPQLELSVLVEDALVESTVLALETVGSEVEIQISSVDAIIRRGEQQAPVRVGLSEAPLAKRAGTIPIHTAHARA